MTQAASRPLHSAAGPHGRRSRAKPAALALPVLLVVSLGSGIPPTSDLSRSSGPASSSRPAEPASRDAAQIKPLQGRFSIRTATGESVFARVESWQTDVGLTVSLGTGGPRLIPTSDVVQLDAADADPPGAVPRAPGRPTRGLWVLSTLDGESLPGDVTGGDDTTVTLLHPDHGVLPIALERVRSIAHVGDAPPELPIATGLGEQAQPGSAEDRIELANGDRVSGLVDRIDAAGVSLQTGSRRQVLRWSAVRSVAMAAAGAESGERGVRLRIQTSDCTIVLATSVDWSGDALRLARPGREALRLPASDVSRIEVLGGRWQWLSERPVETYESIPFMTRRWPLMRDANAAGGPLRCGGRTSARGLGLHSAARVAWTLDGGYSRFVARVGIDDSGGPWSDADLEVRVDGQTVARLEHLRHAEAPRPLDADVSGARRLEIVIGFGDNGDVQDRVDLLDAALVRAATP